MFIAKQISSLEKVREFTNLNMQEITAHTALRGERFSYQITMQNDKNSVGYVHVESTLKKYLKLYRVEQSVMDKPTTEDVCEAGYITTVPGLMPDLLTPFESGGVFSVGPEGKSLWIELNLPTDIEAGSYPITVTYEQFEAHNPTAPSNVQMTKIMDVEVLPVTVAEQSLIYTRWFYADCIADQHNVPIYSDAHFDLIEAYIKEAVDIGINMILVPIHTPPLDTAIGTRRPCVQLVDIKKDGDKYSFGFEKLERFIDICKRCGVKYYEMAHMFSQWGAKCAANIMVEENGKKDYMFGWHVASTDPIYMDFLKQYISALSEELDALGVAENTYYHISDEPTTDKIDAYRTAVNIIKPFIKNSRTFDALSDYEFYEQGLVECPVTGVGHIHDFLNHDIPNQWTYYCCGPQAVHTNSFIAMTSQRTRILGVLLYKYDIKGFLHWGFNFYNAMISYYKINPYVTTSADGALPSGDPFIVYPAKNGAYPSIRGKVTYEAIGDMKLLRTLEGYVGRGEVIKMIDEIAGMDVKFYKYPLDVDYLPKLRSAVIKKIREHC
jgi:hypothetical protein